jgi:hypothetical protein
MVGQAGVPAIPYPRGYSTWVLWSAVKIMGAVFTVQGGAWLYNVDFRQEVVRPIMNSLMLFAESQAMNIVGGISEQWLKKHADNLIDKMQDIADSSSDLIGGLKKYNKNANLVALGVGIAIGGGAEYWVSRKKDFSFTRALMYSVASWSSIIVAVQVGLFQLAVNAIPAGKTGKETESGWEDIRDQVHARIDSIMSMLQSQSEHTEVESDADSE